ncbi:MAG: TonB family protein [Rhizomicrobium sp.]
MHRLVTILAGAALLACVGGLAATAEPPPASSDPAPAGPAHYCDPAKYYSQTERDQNIEGVTTLSLRVTADGTVENPAVKESSGDAVLDQAAMRCVATWRYKAATKDGAPVAAPWTVQVSWVLGAPLRQPDGSLIVPRNAGAPHSCALDSTLYADAGIEFRIEADGSVTGVTLKHASGDADFDRKAQACVAAWRFEPPLVNGKPAAIQWRANIVPPGVFVGPTASVERHMCPDALYPTSAWTNGIEGRTLLKLFIKPDGSVENITVLKTSGSPDLDTASIACATPWKYKPATLNGVPVESPWVTRVSWGIDLGPNAGRAPRAIGAAHRCAERPRDAASSATPGKAVLDFGVDTDGKVVNVSVSQSSGDKTFDAYAVTCVSAWHFDPTDINGVPIRVYEQAGFDWSTNTTEIADAPPGIIPGANDMQAVCPNNGSFYPPEAVRQHLEGQATVDFRIKTDGTVGDPTIEKTSGSDILDRQALLCVAHFHYRPATHNGQPIEAPWHVTLNWKING